LLLEVIAIELLTLLLELAAIALLDLLLEDIPKLELAAELNLLDELAALELATELDLLELAKLELGAELGLLLEETSKLEFVNELDATLAAELAGLAPATELTDDDDVTIGVSMLGLELEFGVDVVTTAELMILELTAFFELELS
jgi:hypothetical protein